MTPVTRGLPNPMLGKIPQAVINLDALRHNLARARAAAPGSRVMAVTKANGYGHGLLRVAASLRDADALAVARVGEGVQLRDAGSRMRVVVLEGCFDERELAEAAGRNLDLVFHQPYQLRLLQLARLPRAPRCWLKVDTGMHRLGFGLDAALDAYATLAEAAPGEKRPALWATDALLTKNAYFMAYRDKQRITEIERYERQTPEGVAMLLGDKDVEVISSKQYPDEESPPQLDPMTGQPVPALLYDIELRRVQEKGKVCIRVLPPERVKVSQYTPSFRLNECDYFEFYEDCTISKLRADGFDVPDDIASDEDSYDTEDDTARDVYTESRDESNDPAMRRVRARMIWIRHDTDEDSYDTEDGLSLRTNEGSRDLHPHFKWPRD